MDTRDEIKGFKLTHRLGAGGMAEVWAAVQPITKTQVAIKLLRADISRDRHHVARFFREAVAVNKIKHAGIVKIFDVGIHAGRAFLIMELLEGEILASRIKRAGWLPVGDVADIGRQIASILGAMHAVGITHRDVKPENLFLTPDSELPSRERVKLFDFGIARQGLGLTAVGAAMGTPAYMAPEQWNSAAHADARADIYSLGCLLFEMCCGRPPFMARSFGEAYAKHQYETPPRPSSLVPGLPREMDDLIVRMLSKAPADRPSARDIGAAFARLSLGQPRLLDATLPHPPPPHNRRLRPLVIAAAILVLVNALLASGFLCLALRELHLAKHGQHRVEDRDVAEPSRLRLAAATTVDMDHTVDEIQISSSLTRRASEATARTATPAAGTRDTRRPSTGSPAPPSMGCQ